MLCSRFLKFHETVTKSKKESVSLLANISRIDEKTVYKRNLTKIANECNVKIDKLTATIVKNKMNYCQIPEQELWRIPFIHNLLKVRSDEWTVDNMEPKEINELINFTCTT